MRKLLRSLLISLLILLSLAIIGCETTSKLPNVDMDREAPDENSKNVEMKKYSGDKLEYLLKAKTITRYYEKQRTIADSVYIITVEEGTGNISTVTCDTTIIDDK